MAEATAAAATRPRFDDRVDVAPDINLRETLALLGRSLSLLSAVKGLFAAKFALGAVAILPTLLLLPFVAKIVVDQVVLGKPFGVSAARFPPFLQPVIDLLEGLSPLGIMAWITAASLLLLALFGLRGAPSQQVAEMPLGYDAATQSEQALSAGHSHAGGLWGAFEVLVHIRLTQRLANGLRTRLLRAMTRLKMTTLDDQRIGDSVYRVMYDAPLVPDICHHLTVAPFSLLLGAALSLYTMQYSYGAVAPEVVWIAAGIIPLVLLLTAPLSSLARRVNQASRASGAATTNAMEESVDNIASVQSLGGMRQETDRFDGRSRESFRRHRHTVLVEAAVIVISFGCAGLALAAGFLLITDDVIDGTLSPGDFATLFFFLYGLQESARLLGGYWLKLQKNVAAVRRVFFFIDYASEVSPGLVGLRSLNRGIRLDGVSFSYPRQPQPAVADIDLDLRLGELVAFVGPTGAGKTTLAYLLPGYLRPTAGRVYFDDQDLAEVSVDAIRSQVTYVFQEHMLLSESIRDNLLLARPDATDEDMRAACRTAGADEFVERLPNGLDTRIGRGGDTLSVGQKQRLSIARGVLRGTPVLVLDEPTSALDPRTENALVASLRKTARSALVVVIAHRLSTIREADRIVFLDQGRIADVGTHEALMADPDSAYRRFVELQGG